MIVLIALSVLLMISLIAGYNNCQEISIAFEFNRFNSPFYKIGVFSERFFLTDNQVEDEIVIGLLFVNIVIVFWKTEEDDFQA